MTRLKHPILFLVVAILAISACKKTDLPLTGDRLKSILLGKDTVTMYAGEKKSVPLTISPSNYS